MRKWAFLTVAAAIVVIGCAGSGGSDGTSGSATATTATTATTSGDLRVNIPTPPGQLAPYGRLELGFLTGQGRAIGDLSLVIRRVQFVDEFGEVRNQLATPLALALGQYSFQTVAVNIPFEGQNSRFFENYEFDPQEVLQDNGSSTPTRLNCFATRNGDGSINRAWPPNPITLDARVFPGRTTLVPLFLDDSMFAVETDDNPPIGDPCSGQIVVFDVNRFNEINEPPVKGFLSDYISFDISAMPAGQRPRMSAASGGATVGRVYLTGDNWAVSQAGVTGQFEVLTPQVSQPIVGTYSAPGVTDNVHPGTFTLNQLDPTDLFNLKTIVALQGTWQEYTRVLQGFGTWNLVTFPTSVDANNQEVMFFRKDETGITSLFFGYVDFDLDEMHLFPVKSLVNGLFDPGDEVVAAINTQVDKFGVNTVAPQLTRSGTFTVTTPGGLPADAPTSGTYVVYRV